MISKNSSEIIIHARVSLIHSLRRFPPLLFMIPFDGMKDRRVSKTMAKVKSENTGPEILLRKKLWERGHRYRLHRASLPGKPDIVFVSLKVAVFVDGDYWHGRQWRLRGFKSLDDQLKNINNKEYWKAKIEKNMARDREVNARLKKAGWKVIRVWESDLKKNPRRAVDRIERELEKRKRMK